MSRRPPNPLANPCLIIFVVVFGMAILGTCLLSGLTLASVAYDPADPPSYEDLAWIILGFFFGTLMLNVGAAAAKR